MATEIEHKYLVKNYLFREMAYKKEKIRQGYLCREPNQTVRIRIAGHKAFITVKGSNHGDTRLEFEYEIPYDDAVSMLSLCPPPIIEKTRYFVKVDNLLWEVDEFQGHRNGLVTAEVEIPYSTYDYKLPPFVGKNITEDPSYFNSNL